MFRLVLDLTVAAWLGADTADAFDGDVNRGSDPIEVIVLELGNG